MATKKATAKSKKGIAARMIQFVLDAPQANRVSVAGDFNKWDMHTLSAKKSKDGTWKIKVSLPPGRYQYKFVVDGQWWNDPRCSMCVPDGFGSTNCVAVVK